MGSCPDTDIDPGCFYFEFSKALKGIFLPFDWPLQLLWFWFYDIQSKSALFDRLHRLMLSVLSYSVITLQDEGDSNDSDDEENNWPELRYGIYKNPTPGPSWREDDEVSPNLA